MSSLSDSFKKAWEIHNLVLDYLIYAVVFVLGSASVIYQIRTRVGITLPDFGLTFFESTIVWGVLALPFYIIGVFLIMITFMFGVLFGYLGFLFLKHLPAIVAIFVELWREERNGT